MLDEKVCVEGMFTICLRSGIKNGKYVFYTNTTDHDVSKTPMGMFEEETIDNDLKMVNETIREYYNLGENNDEKH